MRHLKSSGSGLDLLSKIKADIERERNTDYYFAPFFRVLVGLFCMLHFLSIISDFQVLYGKNGFVPSEVGELFKGYGILGFSEFSKLAFSAFGLNEAGSIILFKILYLFFSLSLALGFLTRLSALFLLILQITLAKGASLYTYGVDNFTTIALFYCMVFPLNRRFSIDSLIFKLKPTSISKYRKILQIHLCFIYFFSGFEKALGENWWNGESIWKALTMPILGNHSYDFSFLATWSVLPTVIGWSVIVIELAYPFFIFRKSTSKYWLAMVVSMHIGILLFLNLYFFSAIMIILNISAFLNLSKEEVGKAKIV
ncbi:hypothetical protein [Pedobacter jeongneungensis]|uniref:hypothetical protein n=1 Tax=Pedobacter jeongneungensis TaxID=947309 RepID=UPI0031DDA6A9